MRLFVGAAGGLYTARMVSRTARCWGWSGKWGVAVRRLRACGAIVLAAVVVVVLAGCGAWDRAPEGFAALFNGRDLEGWQGLIEEPARARMGAGELAAAQAAADVRMRAHWSVRDGVLEFDGRGENLCTVERFKDFELWLDWKIEKDGDSGIYLRGTPQVQIWDNAAGSGGLYNNQRHRSTPLVVADRPVGAWNRFRIRMVGDKVSVWLNGELVVDETPLENYWRPGEPVASEGPIELQAHGTRLWFKNIYVRRL